MQSTQMPKEADPHDVFAIETMLAARADRTHALKQDAEPAAPPIHVAPEISPDFSPASFAGMPVAQIEPTFGAADIRDVRVENTSFDEIRVDDHKPLPQPPKWAKRVVMTLLGLCGAVAAAAWQHYGDHAKAMAAEWAPPFVMAALYTEPEKPAAAEPPVAQVVDAAAADQSAGANQTEAQPAAAVQPQPAQPQQAAVPAPAPAAPGEPAPPPSQDISAMSQQIEELKATIVQLKASQAQMARELAAKSSEPKAAEVKPVEPAQRPRVAAAAAAPPARPAAAPVRKPKPAAQAAYIPPPLPTPVVQAAPPPPALADDGQPIVRPPMPVR